MKINLFNPEHDMALASYSPYYKAPAEIVRMKDDLSALPVWYAEKGEMVKIENNDYADAFKLQCLSGDLMPWGTFTDSWYTDEVFPWGWDPAVTHFLQEKGVTDVALPTSSQLEQIKLLSGRQQCVQVLHDFTEWPGICGKAVICNSINEVEAILHSEPEIILKAPWSGSGRGLSRTSLSAWTPNLQGWTARIIRTQGAIMAEPLFNKVVDFAMEFKMDECLTFIGYSLFETDTHGNYKLNTLTSDASILAYLSRYVSMDLLDKVRGQLLLSLSSLLADNYKGYLGVDMMICFQNGEYYVHPCVEINLRMNMGVVSRLMFDRYVTPESKGSYIVAHFSKDGEACLQDRNYREQYPQKVVDGRMLEGYFPLTPVFDHTRYQCYVFINL